MVAAVEAAVTPWIMEAISVRYPGPLPDELRQRADDVARKATIEMSEALGDLLALDIDEQWTNPLSIIRSVVKYPTQLLQAAGVPAVARDAQLLELYPDDVYALSPASFADLGPGVHEPGLAWGAAKAHVHLSRRRQDRSQ